MIPPNDVVADLPAPMDDEPPSVRQDIADELADHLACAYRRELFRNADEGVARQQVLDRFGDPRRIAYQLWFQALWGRIMLNRFGRVVQGLKIVGGLLVLFFVFRMAEQQTALHNQLVFMTANYNSMQAQSAGTRMLLEQLLARFPAPPQPEGASGMSSGMSGSPMMGMGSAVGMMGAEGGPGMMPGIPDPEFGDGSPMMGTATPAGMGSNANPPKRGLKLRVMIQGEKNEPTSDCMLSVTNESGEKLIPYLPQSSPESPQGMGASMGMMVPGMSPGRSRPLEANPDKNGEMYFAQMNQNRVPRILEPGRYIVEVVFADGRRGTHRFTVAPSHKDAIHEETIICPPADQKAYVLFHTPVLEDRYIQAGISIRAVVNVKPNRIGKTDWVIGDDDRVWNLYFDPKTGAPTRYDTLRYRKPPQSGGPNPMFDLSELPAEERFLNLPPGSYQVYLQWQAFQAGGIRSLANNATFRSFPAAGAAQKGVLTIAADTRDVLLDIPEEMLEALKILNLKETDHPIETPADATKVP